jgi:1-acyl-sn-glycerol-3-phosphate acyltransferase
VSYTLSLKRVALAVRTTIDVASEARALSHSPPDRDAWIARRQAQGAIVQRSARELLTTFGVDLVVRGCKPSGQVLLVANHLGWLDPLILGALHPCLPLAKEEVSRWPVIGAQAAALGTIFVDRDSTARRAIALRRARRAMIEGASIMNFPEGTTTRGDIVLPFRRGLFGVARDLGVKIVPARISYADPAMAWVDDETFLPHFVAMSRRPHVRVTVHVAPPLPVGPLDDATSLADRARKIIQHLHYS